MKFYRITPNGSTSTEYKFLMGSFFTIILFCLRIGLNREDAMDRARWRKLIGMIDDYDESSG